MSETTDQPKNQGPQIYSMPMEYKDEFDNLRQLVQLFSYQWQIQGKVTSVLRNKLVTLLTIYVKDGFNKETKIKAEKMLSVGTPSINSMNLELRQSGYLKKDKMNTRINHLHEDLLLLKDYVSNLTEGSQPLLIFQFVRSDG